MYVLKNFPRILRQTAKSNITSKFGHQNRVRKHLFKISKKSDSNLLLKLQNLFKLSMYIYTDILSTFLVFLEVLSMFGFTPLGLFKSNIKEKVVLFFYVFHIFTIIIIIDRFIFLFMIQTDRRYLKPKVRDFNFNICLIIMM